MSSPWTHLSIGALLWPKHKKSAALNHMLPPLPGSDCRRTYTASDNNAPQGFQSPGSRISRHCHLCDSSIPVLFPEKWGFLGKRQGLELIGTSGACRKLSAPIP